MPTTPTASEQTSGLHRFRALRDRLEGSVLPLATSLDGRRFIFQASLHQLELRLGGYVVLEQEGVARLGQILDLRMEHQAAVHVDIAESGAPGPMSAGVTVRHAAGSGIVLGGDGIAFHDAALRPARADEVGAWLGERAAHGAPLELGELVAPAGVPATVDARGLNRHTFLCGQSGSGKTYALGVLLERVLTETRLRVVVLDPNGDFVRLATVRSGTDPPTAARYRAAAREIAVHSATASGEHRLCLRLAELAPEAQAALLRLDPVGDREEHAELVRLLASGAPPSAAALEAAGRPEALRLALRARNLGVEDLAVWAGAHSGSVLDAIVDPAARCTVVDLGSLPTRDEQELTAGALLRRMWETRMRRDPVLVVIDEAHNVCPAAPPDALTALATEQTVQIAAEGRKFGIYLLLATQRPQKVHENVVSQCDNLVLMRLNSRTDAEFAARIFSFVPPSLVEQAATFALGEALVAGKIAPHPMLVRVGARISEEGGVDVPTTWAHTRG
jgi:hypothetical protein